MQVGEAISTSSGGATAGAAQADRSRAAISRRRGAGTRRGPVRPSARRREHAQQLGDDVGEGGGVAHEVVGLAGGDGAGQPGLDRRAAPGAGGEERGPLGQLGRHPRQHLPDVERGAATGPSADGQHRGGGAQRGEVGGDVPLPRVVGGAGQRRPSSDRSSSSTAAAGAGALADGLVRGRCSSWALIVGSSRTRALRARGRSGGASGQSHTWSRRQVPAATCRGVAAGAAASRARW